MKVKIYTQLVILAVWLLAICPSFVYAQVRGQSAAVSNPGSTNKPANPDANDVKTETEVPKADQPDRHFSTRREVMAPVNNYQPANRRPVNYRPVHRNRPLNSRIIPDFNNRIRLIQNNLRFERASQRIAPIRKLNPAEYSFKNQRAPKINTLYKEQASLNPAFTKMADLSRSGSDQLNSTFSRMAKVSGRISGELNPALTIKLSSAFTKLGNLNRASSQLSSQFLRLAQANSLTKELNSGFKRMAELSKQPARLMKIKPVKFAKLQPDLTRLSRPMPQAKQALISFKPEAISIAKLSVPAKATVIKPVQLPKLKPAVSMAKATVIKPIQLPKLKTVSLIKPSYAPIASLKAPNYQSLKAPIIPDITKLIQPASKLTPAVFTSLKPKAISIVKLPAPTRETISIVKLSVPAPEALKLVKLSLSTKTTQIEPIQLAKLKPSPNIALSSANLIRPTATPKSYLNKPDWNSLNTYNKLDLAGFIRKQPKQRQIMIAGLKAKGANVAKLQVLDKWVTSYERLSETSQKAVSMLKTGHVNDMSILIDAEQARVDLEQRTTDVNNLIAQGDNILEQFIVEEINLTLEPIYPVFEGITAINSGLPMPALIPVIGN